MFQSFFAGTVGADTPQPTDVAEPVSTIHRLCSMTLHWTTVVQKTAAGHGGGGASHRVRMVNTHPQATCSGSRPHQYCPVEVRSTRLARLLPPRIRSVTRRQSRCLGQNLAGLSAESNQTYMKLAADIWHCKSWIWFLAQNESPSLTFDPDQEMDVQV